jgi:UDP-GlcNAc:undecaprenyl-phosphate GlcNAc-1-phosphate transferase
LTLIMGISGCLVFLLVVTSRRDELANLRDDLQDRLTRGRQERQAAQLAWEAIQRIELATTEIGAYEIVDATARSMGCELVQIACGRPESEAACAKDPSASPAFDGTLLSGPSAVFRLSGGNGLMISVGLPSSSVLAADIVFRYLQRLSQALADRLERLESSASGRRRAGDAGLGLPRMIQRST